MDALPVAAEPVAPVGPDVVDLLTRQHRRLEAMFDTLVEAGADDERRHALKSVADELMVHIGAEEQVFYPAVRAARTEDILMESLEEHLSLKRLLADLLELRPGDETFLAKCKVLREQAEHHHEEEEEHLFPKVRQLMSEPLRGALGADVAAFEQRMAAQSEPGESVKEQTGSAAPLE